ncbi:helix-turn-helix domain-containing protein [Streptomyces sp. NPDC058268]|uniref:helix-turn-helix domain-containing protein n=1 Tax=Streptomyces sp. NPDC058268 TaxID=3346413 RepID=UPI0036E8C2EE
MDVLEERHQDAWARPPDDDESARSVLARQLQYLREKSGKSLAQLAEDTTYNRSYLHRLETGERLSQLPVMQGLDEVYETGGLLVRLWRLARQEAFKDRYKLFMQYEAKASIMHKYMCAVPGLLQTEDYARVVLSGPGLEVEELEEMVLARIGRQDLLRRDPPPHLRVILDESALRRPTQERKIWHDQLAHLLESQKSPHIVLQVLPFDAGVHDLMGGSLSLLWSRDGSCVAYLEGNKSGELVEDAGEVAGLRLSYDRIRDLALSPPDSVRFLEHVMEDSTS